MTDLRTVNQAIYDTLEEVAPFARYVIVLWEDNKACISSNETDEEIVHGMLLGATKIVATTEGEAQYERTGHA